MYIRVCVRESASVCACELTQLLCKAAQVGAEQTAVASGVILPVLQVPSRVKFTMKKMRKWVPTFTYLSLYAPGVLLLVLKILAAICCRPTDDVRPTCANSSEQVIGRVIFSMQTPRKRLLTTLRELLGAGPALGDMCLYLS